MRSDLLANFAVEVLSWILPPLRTSWIVFNLHKYIHIMLYIYIHVGLAVILS